MRSTAAVMLALTLSFGCGGGESTARNHGKGDGGSFGTDMGGSAGSSSGGGRSGSAGVAAAGSDGGGSGAASATGGGGGLGGAGGVGSGTGGTFAGTGGRGDAGSSGVGGSDGGTSGVGGSSGGAGGRACITAVEVEFTDGNFMFTGDTSTGVDEFPELTCDSGQVAISLYERQIYFRLQASALSTYRFQLTPSFYGFVYVFPLIAACDGAAMQEACSSAGETGMVSRIVNPGQTGASTFQPALAGTYFFAVDSDTSAGTFEITVTES